MTNQRLSVKEAKMLNSEYLMLRCTTSVKYRFRTLNVWLPLSIVILLSMFDLADKSAM